MIKILLIVYSACFLMGWIYFHFSRSKKPVKFGKVLLLMHLLFTLFCAINFHWIGSKDPGVEALVWIPLYIIDQPVSMVFPLLPSFQSGMVRNYYLPLSIFAFLGSFQYFLVGTVIGWFFTLFGKRDKE